MSTHQENAQRLYNAVQHAAKHLPEGCAVVVKIENGGYDVGFDFTEAHITESCCSSGDDMQDCIVNATNDAIERVSTGETSAEPPTVIDYFDGAVA